MSFPRFCLPILASVCTLFAAPALSEKINEPWQSMREAAVPLEDKACAGDARAVRDVWRRIEQQNDVVLQSNIAWLSANCDSFDVSTEEIVKWVASSAYAGYPIAQSNYGMRLINGWGVRKNPTEGMTFLIKAYEGGYATALAYASKEFATGEHLRQSMRQAETYLRIAKRKGADAPAIRNAEKAIAAAGGKPSQSGSTCCITLMHVCSIAPRGVGSRDAVAQRSFPTVSFAGCGGDTARDLTLVGNRIEHDDDSKTIPPNVVTQLEKQLQAFKRKAIRAYPHCNKFTRTSARIYRTKDAAQSSQGFLMSIMNASLRDSYYVD